MNYDEAIEYINGAHKFGVKLGLNNIKNLLELLGNPHKKLKFVHVAGTNGKGSTVAFINSILMESGYKVGAFTSPYIERFTERICINKEEISKVDVARITSIIREKVSQLVEKGHNHPTIFEIITAIALQYYWENDCDIVVLEVGLGGRYDSTNIIDTPLVSVITSVSFDHMKILGDTLPQIAYEKAGIIKQNGHVVLYPQSVEVEEVIEKTSAKMNSKLHKINVEHIKLKEFGVNGQTFDYGSYIGLNTKLLGEYQLKNAAVAITACQVIKQKMGNNITANTIKQGISKTRWQGRLELLWEKPIFFIDGAHNEDGARVLVETFERYFPGNKKIFIMGVLRDKAYIKMVQAISKIASKIYTVTPSSDRALPASELAEVIRPYCSNVVVCDKITESIKEALKQANQDDVICAFGSLYYIGEVRGYFKNLI